MLSYIHINFSLQEPHKRAKLYFLTQYRGVLVLYLDSGELQVYNLSYIHGVLPTVAEGVRGMV